MSWSLIILMLIICKTVWSTLQHFLGNSDFECRQAAWHSSTTESERYTCTARSSRRSLNYAPDVRRINAAVCFLLTFAPRRRTEGGVPRNYRTLRLTYRIFHRSATGDGLTRTQKSPLRENIHGGSGGGSEECFAIMIWRRGETFLR